MMTTVLYADIILNLNLQQVYTYRVPAELQTQCTVGKRVVVQFAAKRFYTAVVYRLHTEAPNVKQVKEVLEVIDQRPVVEQVHLDFWKWMANYYMASLGEVYRAALPSVMKIESETEVLLSKSIDLGFDTLSDEQLVVVRHLEHGKATIKDLQKHCSLQNPLRIIKQLIADGKIELKEQLSKVSTAKYENYIVLHSSFCNDKALTEALDKLRNAKKQQQLLYALLEICAETCVSAELYATCKVPQRALLNKADCSLAVLNELVRKEILVRQKVAVSRLEENSVATDFPVLSDAQGLAYDAIQRQMTQHNTVLFQGVTGSGKTEIYMHLIQRQIQAGKQVLYLLPEIALSTQIIRRMQSVFGDKVGIYHSKFRSVERAEVWEQVLKNNLSPQDSSHQVIVGVRSSIFLPFTNLGLIIIDEEHENTFKQYDPAPRYNARDAAIMLAHLQKAKVLLGTATPSVESFQNARDKKFGYVQLSKRYGDIALPEILVVDTLDAKKRKKMKSIFSSFLLEKMQIALEKGEQIILFQNRRGYSPYVQCNNCGWIPKCEHCDVSLTYHKYTNNLTCHYCGYALSGVHECEQCKSTHIETKGFGTEQIEDEIKVFFPDIIVARLDVDTTRNKNAFQEIIAKFERREINVLVGTQMVTKGLDFDNVSLVGIMNADAMLNFPDFRANERSFHLMHQVSGRAGRRQKQGQVVVQTTAPEHQVIQHVVNSNPHALLRTEIMERQQFLYPPFVRMIKIVVKGKHEDNAEYAAKNIAHVLLQIKGLIVLGPEKGLISRLKGFFVRQIIVKITDTTTLSATKRNIKHQIDHLKNTKALGRAFVQIDVDPI